MPRSAPHGARGAHVNVPNSACPQESQQSLLSAVPGQVKLNTIQNLTSRQHIATRLFESGSKDTAATEKLQEILRLLTGLRQGHAERADDIMLLLAMLVVVANSTLTLDRFFSGTSRAGGQDSGGNW